MRKFKNTLIKKIIVYSLLFALICPMPANRFVVYAAETPSAEYDLSDAIHISSVEDLLSFSKACSLDTWSQNKIFVLDNDIDLSNTAFEPVPTFGGIFLGQGHTIRGLSLNSGSNHIGLFRYVQEQGAIYQLSVSGTAFGDNGHSGLALLAGCNYGLISGCSSSGNVTGEDQVGSIAGVNELTGVITDCASNGVVYGSHLVGGISGNNKGSILNSTNHCFINTTASDEGIDLSSFNVDAAITDFLTTENASSVTDIGGIAGYSSGVIRACINNGSIGYQHVGYNIGGIAGRQTGYIEGCVNYGLLNGRKDVGGIAGQMEPSSELEFTQDMLSRLNTELDTLHQLLTKLNNDASNTSTSLTGQVSLLLDSVEGAQGAVDNLMDNASGYFDDFSTLTDLTSLPSPKPISLDFLDKLPSPSPSASPTAAPAATAVPTATPAPTAAPVAPTATPAPTVAPGTDDSTSPGDTSGTNTGTASDDTSGTNNGESSDDVSGGANENENSEGAFTPELLYADSPSYFIRRLDAPDSISDASLIPTASPDADRLENWINDVSGNTIKNNITIDREQIEKDINNAQENIYSDASKALSDLQGNVKDQAAIISSRITSSKNSLSNSFSAIISDMRILNSLLDGQDQILLDDFQAIVDELNVIGNLLTNPDYTDPDDIMSDVSDDDQLNDTTGKVMNCINNGKVNGDFDVGGIAGSLSRENTLDPENDFNLDEYDITLNFRYKERIVVRQCRNYGNIFGKTDYIGGIAGEMTLGSIMECISSGQISGDGAMIGGIAGSSASTIRSSSAKCTLKGDHQVGGIAGYGTNISDCYSMVWINESNYYSGSIAGNVSSDASISNNYFVEGSFAGIDGVSYEGKAQPLSYKDFMASPGLPDIFNNIYLTFTADDKTVAVITLNYGDTFHPDSLPQVPFKEGFIGRWPDFDQNSITFDQTIEAVYTEYITTLESSQLAGDRAVVLIEGMFGPDDTFTLTPAADSVQDASPESEYWKISISSVSTGPYTIRYLIPEKTEYPQIEIYEDDTWKEIGAKTDGSYYVFTSSSPKIIFRCTDQPPVLSPDTLLVLTIIAAGLLMMLLLIMRQKKKKGARP